MLCVQIKNSHQRDSKSIFFFHKGQAIQSQVRHVDIKNTYPQCVNIYGGSVELDCYLMAEQHRSCCRWDGCDPTGWVTIHREETRTNEIRPEGTIAEHMDVDGRTGWSWDHSLRFSALRQLLWLWNAAVRSQVQQLNITVLIFYTQANVHHQQKN